MARELSQSRASPRPRRGHERLDAAEAARRGVRRAEVDALVEAGYMNAVAVEGGYSTWMSKYTPFGRKVPPKGKFVSTGREALKSGLDLDPTVASAYEENWGRQDYKP